MLLPCCQPQPFPCGRIVISQRLLDHHRLVVRGIRFGRSGSLHFAERLRQEARANTKVDPETRSRVTGLISYSPRPDSVSYSWNGAVAFDRFQCLPRLNEEKAFYYFLSFFFFFFFFAFHPSFF